LLGNAAGSFAWLEIRPASISIVAMERYGAARSLYQQHGRVG
jgi:hypothetical protein